MNTSDDDTQRHGLTLLIILVALVVIGVVGLGVSKARPPRGNAAAAAQAPAPVQTVFKLYFEPGSAALPHDAQDVLGPAADLARSRAHATVWLSGYHDASGDAQANAELAKNRALAVQHGLEANGVSGRTIELSRPQLTTGGVDAKEARRVEISVR